MTILQGFWLCVYALVALQVGWWALIAIQWIRLFQDGKKRSIRPSENPISVVIAARNESENLLHFIPQWLQQLRPEDELIVVNDRSSDDTSLVLKAFEERYDAIKIVHANEPPGKGIFPGKKYAITLGIKAARHEHLALTDADCWPAGDSWLHTAADGMDAASVILGCGFVKPQNSFVSNLAHADSLHTAMLYQGFARMGMPYMGVGRSMAYHKSVFFSQGGFMAHQHIRSGDDDLFVSGLRDVSLISRPDMLTWTNAPASLAEYISQRTRHSTTSFQYRWLQKLLLGSYYVSLALFWPLAIALFLSDNLYLTAALLSIRLILLYCSFRLLAATSKTSLSIFNYVWSEFLLAVCYPLFTIGSMRSKSHKWKS